VVRLRRGDLEAAPPRGYPPPPRAWSRPTSWFALRRRGLETAPPRGSPSAAGGLKPPPLADRLRRRGPETPPRGFPPPVKVLLSKQRNGENITIRDVAGNAMAVRVNSPPCASGRRRQQGSRDGAGEARNRPPNLQNVERRGKP
jgi:hypothetical protein